LNFNLFILLEIKYKKKKVKRKMCLIEINRGLGCSALFLQQQQKEDFIFLIQKFFFFD
jgi:hypothetical protein